METETPLTELQQAQIEAAITSTEKEAEVIEARADAQIAEAHAQEAIAEARADAAEEIVAAETEEESEDLEWAEQQFSSVNAELQNLRTAANSQQEALANLLQLSNQLLTLLSEMKGILSPTPTPVSPTPPVSEIPETQVPESNNPASVEENREAKTSQKRSKRRI